MGTTPTRWGAGRVAFIGQLKEIKAEIAKGLPLTQIYEAKRPSLGGIGYSAFRRLVSVYAADARPRPVSASPPASLLTMPTPIEGKPSARKTGFHHDANIDEERVRRLTGRS